MPATVRRQKASRKPNITPAKQYPSLIDTYTRVSKSTGSSDHGKNIGSSAKKRKAVASVDADPCEDEILVKPTSSSVTQTTVLSPAKRGRGPAAKKRKAEGSLVQQEPKTPSPAAPPAVTAATPTPVSALSKHGRGRLPKRARSPSPAASIQPDHLLKRLRLQSPPSRSSSPLPANIPIRPNSAGDSDVKEQPRPSSLPHEATDLIRLHASLLKTLTLHYAHNGTNAPVDLRAVCPDVARAWGKTRVTEADVRLCLGVLNVNKDASDLFLTDYGRGKVCLERDQSRDAGAPNEEKLNRLFAGTLRSLWSESMAAGERDVQSFMQRLPRAAIRSCDSIAKASPMLAKGQQRLEALREQMALRKTAEQEAKPALANLTNPDGSKMGLLDRIRFKQLQKSALPPGLSPAQLERRGALQRVIDVAALVDMLSRASADCQGRISFTMAATVEKLKDSFRMGISKEEAVRCVRLLASEVAPEWIKVVTIGQRENVVIEMDRQLSRSEVERRVQAIIARG